MLGAEIKKETKEKKKKSRISRTEPFFFWSFIFYFSSENDYAVLTQKNIKVVECQRKILLKKSSSSNHRRIVL